MKSLKTVKYLKKMNKEIFGSHLDRELVSVFARDSLLIKNQKSGGAIEETEFSNIEHLYLNELEPFMFTMNSEMTPSGKYRRHIHLANCSLENFTRDNISWFGVIVDDEFLPLWDLIDHPKRKEVEYNLGHDLGEFVKEIFSNYSSLPIDVADGMKTLWKEFKLESVKNHNLYEEIFF